jgi:hypothetical protein
MMKLIPVLAGAALLAFAPPALAKSDKGHGQGKHHAYSKGHDKHGVKGKSHGKRVKIAYYGYGKGGCPPGLRWKNERCMPPGQFKKLYGTGQRYPGNYGSLWNYNQIPYDLRARYDFDRSNRYYYADGYLYQVDPRTRLIERVVNAIVR